MVDLIPKEARKTGEGKGSVLVKKGCEIVRWFVSSYSCFFLSFTTSLTVPSQLLFFFLLKLFVQSFLWKAYTYVTRISRFRCLSEAATRIPPSTLTTFAIVTSATASGWLSYCKALGEPAKTTWDGEGQKYGQEPTRHSFRMETRIIEWDRDTNDTMRYPDPTLYFCVLSLFFFYFFGLTFVHLLLFTLLPALFFLAAVIVSSQLLSFFWLTLFVQALWPFWLLGASFDMLGYQPYAILPHFLLLVLFQLLRSNLLFCSSPTFSFILLLLLTIVPSLFFLASLNVPSHLLCCLFFKYHICYAFQSSSSSSESKQIATWYMTKDSLRPPKTPPTLSLHSQSLQPLPPGFRNHGVRTKFIWIGYGCRNPIKVDWWPFLNIST